MSKKYCCGSPQFFGQVRGVMNTTEYFGSVSVSLIIEIVGRDSGERTFPHFPTLDPFSFTLSASADLRSYDGFFLVNGNYALSGSHSTVKFVT